MITDDFITYFGKVKQIGDGRFTALCPAHDDKNPSLAITEVDDRILVKCWSGCTAHEIVESVGLKIGDLFLQPLNDDLKQAYRTQYSENQKTKDKTYLALCNGARKHGEKLTSKELEKERECYLRVNQ